MFLGAKIGLLPKGVILMGWLLIVVFALRKVLSSMRWSFNFLEYSFWRMYMFFWMWAGEKGRLASMFLEIP